MHDLRVILAENSDGYRLGDNTMWCEMHVVITASHDIATPIPHTCVIITKITARTGYFYATLRTYE